jgi:hypothetical protein
MTSATAQTTYYDGISKFGIQEIRELLKLMNITFKSRDKNVLAEKLKDELVKRGYEVPNGAAGAIMASPLGPQDLTPQAMSVEGIKEWIAELNNPRRAQPAHIETNSNVVQLSIEVYESLLNELKIAKAQRDFYRNELYHKKLEEISGYMYLYDLDKGNNTNYNNLPKNIKEMKTTTKPKKFAKLGRVHKVKNIESRHSWNKQRFQNRRLMDHRDIVYHYEDCERDLRVEFMKKWNAAAGSEDFEYPTDQSVWAEMIELFGKTTAKYATRPSIDELNIPRSI